MIKQLYEIQDTVYVLDSNEKYMVSEISIQTTKIEYKLWRTGTTDYHWFEQWQITTEEPTKVGFNIIN